ncbi:hypothetical protein [Methanococcus sp. CF]
MDKTSVASELDGLIETVDGINKQRHPTDKIIFKFNYNGYSYSAYDKVEGKEPNLLIATDSLAVFKAYVCGLEYAYNEM